MTYVIERDIPPPPPSLAAILFEMQPGESILITDRKPNTIASIIQQVRKRNGHANFTTRTVAGGAVRVWRIGNDNNDNTGTRSSTTASSNQAPSHNGAAA